MALTKIEIFNKILDEFNIEELFTAVLNRVMANLKEPTTGLRHTNMKEVRRILGDEIGDTGNYLEYDGDDVDLFILSPLYESDLYVVVGHDVDLTKVDWLDRPNAFTMWKTFEYEPDDDKHESVRNLVAVINICEASPYINKDNILHIIKHEITHYILAFLEFRGKLNLAEIDEAHGMKFTEFLCDFLPFYVLDGVDWTCESGHYRGFEYNNKCVKSFMEYIALFYDDDTQDEYLCILDEIEGILTQHLAPF